MLAESDAPRVKVRSLTTAEESSLEKVFHKYLLSPECMADPDRVELSQLGKSGQDISGVKSLVDGSFTAPGRKQTLVTFFMGNCGALGHRIVGYGLTVVVIMEGGEVVLVTKQGPTEATDLLPIDLENDGVTEIVAMWGDGASGTTYSQAEVWSVTNGMTSLARFETARRSCLLDEPEYFESALLTRWNRATKQRCLLQRRHDLPCP